jgi:hypothetical protein
MVRVPFALMLANSGRQVSLLSQDTWRVKAQMAPTL